MSESLAELPEGWARRTVRDVCLPGQTVRPDEQPDSPFTYVDISAIDRATNTIVQPQELLGRDAPSRARQVIRSGDILFSTVRPNLRTIAPVTEELDGQVASTGFCVLRPGPDVLSQYLLYAVLEEGFQARVEAKARGISYPAVRPPDILDEPICLPPLPEQEVVVARIAAMRELTSATTDEVMAAISAAQQLRESLFSSAYRNGWDLVPLKQCLREKPRNGHSAKATPSGGIRTLTLTAVTNRDFSDANTKLTDADATKVGDLSLEPGDIFIQRSNTPDLVGSAALYSGEVGWAIFPDLLIRVRTSERMLPAFLDLVLQADEARSYFRQAARGTSGSMPKINQGIIESLPVPCPSVAEQELFLLDVGEKIAELDAALTDVRAAERLSEALMRGYLNRSVTGASGATIADARTAMAGIA